MMWRSLFWSSIYPSPKSQNEINNILFLKCESQRFNLGVLLNNKNESQIASMCIIIIDGEGKRKSSLRTMTVLTPVNKLRLINFLDYP